MNNMTMSDIMLKYTDQLRQYLHNPRNRDFLEDYVDLWCQYDDVDNQILLFAKRDGRSPSVYKIAIINDYGTISPMTVLFADGDVSAAVFHIINDLLYDLQVLFLEN